MEQTANDVSSIISNGILDANDNNCCVKNVGDAFAIFHARAPRKGSVAVPGLKDIEVYCPKEDDSTGWTNILSPDYTVYEEYYTGVKGETPEYIEEKRSGNVKRYIEHPIVRITFMRFKDSDCYKFIGIYTLNIEKSIKNNSLVWERATYYCDLRRVYELMTLLKRYEK